jgi:hypothetical protein
MVRAMIDSIREAGVVTARKRFNPCYPKYPGSSKRLKDLAFSSHTNTPSTTTRSKTALKALFHQIWSSQPHTDKSN